MKKTLTRTPKTQSGSKTTSLRARLGGSLVLLALIAGLGFAGSRPAHTAGGPIAVTVANTPLSAITQDSDNPARQPVSVTVILAYNGIDNLINDNIYTVPAGKRLVIDYVTSDSIRPNDANSYSYFVTAIQNNQQQYINFNELPDTAPYSAVSQKAELFADPGTTVSVQADNNVKNAPGTFFTMIGHLVNLP